MLPLYLYSYNKSGPPSQKKIPVLNKWSNEDQSFIVTDGSEDYNDKNILGRMLYNISSLTKDVIDRGLQKADKLNDLSNKVIDSGGDIVEKTSDTVIKTQDSLNNVVGNISSFTNIFRSENIYMYIIGAIIAIIIIKKI